MDGKEAALYQEETLTTLKQIRDTAYRGFTPRGEFSLEQEYHAHDLVYFEGRSYISIGVVKGVDPTESDMFKPYADKGEKGDIGEQGIQGLRGEDGLDGLDGRDADPNQVAESLTLNPVFLQKAKGERGERGPKGDKGDTGPQGAKGEKGDEGKDAYEVWLSLGNKGSAQDFINSLKGGWNYQPGAGSRVPNGGTTGQALIKSSNANQAVEWGTVASAQHWEVNSYNGEQFLEPVDNGYGLLVGNPLSAVLTAGFANTVAHFNGTPDGVANGTNYYVVETSGTLGFPLGSIYTSWFSRGNTTTPSQTLANDHIGAHIFGGMGTTAIAVNGANHVIPGLHARAASDFTDGLAEQDFWLGGYGTRMIGFETDTNAIKLNEAMLAATITAYYDVGTALTIDGTTGQVQGKFSPRITSTASTATPTIDVGTTDQYNLTALAINTVVAAPTGTPADGQVGHIRIKDNGSARTIGWNAIFRAIGCSLPSTTVINKTLYITYKYNAADTKYDVLSVQLEV